MWNILKRLPTTLFVGMITLYQHTLSPDHGWLKGRYPHGYCRYYPTCSEYSKQALKKHGLGKGFLLSLKRVIKCNPFAQPSVDLVP